MTSGKYIRTEENTKRLRENHKSIIGLVFLCDVILFLFLMFSKEWSVESKIKQLNKRFKLC
jgi:hypothetical protein